jgi:hypothetical protein
VDRSPRASYSIMHDDDRMGGQHRSHHDGSARIHRGGGALKHRSTGFIGSLIYLELATACELACQCLHSPASISYLTYITRPKYSHAALQHLS